MKKWAAVACAIALVLATGLASAGCGSTSASGSDGKQVALMIPGPLGDKGVFDSADAGLASAQQSLGIVGKTIESTTEPTTWRQNLRGAAASGRYDLVVTGGAQMVETTRQIAEQHPEQLFVFFDEEIPEDNVVSLTYRANEGSFLAGVLAALVTERASAAFPLSQGRRTVGMVGGDDNPVINDFVVGFKAGVAAVDPDIEVLLSYVGSFNDPQKAYDLTTAMHARGADVVFAAAGASGLGALSAAADADRYAIGVDTNQNAVEPGHVLASMVKRVDLSIVDVARRLRRDALEGATTHAYGLEHGGVGLIFAPRLVPAAVREQVERQRERVLAGEISVPSEKPAG